MVIGVTRCDSIYILLNLDSEIIVDFSSLAYIYFVKANFIRSK